MCGIVGAIADRDVVPVLIEGLKRLEYRGYDSAGIAVVDQQDVRRVRRTGRVAEMEGAAAAEGFNASLGIGHTRWATHGGVTEANAHPHISHGVALVHNGIIENHEEQREKLRALGYVFESQTDTEVIAHLMHHHLKGGDDLLAALQRTVKELTGAYALAVVSRQEPDRMVCARMGCPLLIGVGEFRMQDAVAHSFYPKLLAAGVKIVEYRKTQLHAKVAVVDDDWATVGSSNIDALSLFLNQEANIVIKDVAFAQSLRQHIEQGVADGIVIHQDDFKHIGRVRRIGYEAAFLVYRLVMRIFSVGKYA